MKLDEWLKTNRWNGKQFGEMVGKSKSTISLIRHGKIKPNQALIARITVATGGDVTAKDFEEVANEPLGV